jgi:hypothetical protein
MLISFRIIKTVLVKTQLITTPINTQFVRNKGNQTQHNLLSITPVSAAQTAKASCQTKKDRVQEACKRASKLFKEEIPKAFGFPEND